MLLNKENFGSYNLYTIKTDRFKTCHVEIIFRNNVVPEELTIRNVLFDTLLESNKNYQTNRLLNIKLEELYNASIYTITNKVGNMLLTNFCIDFLTPKYSEEKIVEESFKLLFDLIFNPLTSNNEFDKSTVDYVKTKLESEIKSIIENPRKTAIINALKTLGDTPTSYEASGNLNDLNKINNCNLYDYYEKTIQNDYVDIYVIGNLDMEKVSKIIKKYQKFEVIKNHDITVYTKEEKRKLIKEHKDTNYFQTNLVFLLNLNNLTEHEKNYVANIYNIILGGGSLQTKLSKKLRIDNSLCYNVQSSYLKYDNLIMISTGIDINGEEKAIKLIKEATNEMKNNITDDELNESKELILSSLNMLEDSPGRIIDNEFYINLGLIDKLENRINNFKEITKEDIYNLANKINICTIYSLRGNLNEEN